MKQQRQRQRQKTINLTPEEEQERKHLIALALIEELKTQKEQNDGNVRAIIVKRAKEYSRYVSKLSDVAKELREIVVTKEKLCSRRNFYMALQGDEFEQFKDMRRSKNASQPRKNLGASGAPKVLGSASVSITEFKPGPSMETKGTPAADKSLPQHVLDARQAREESNEIQSALGKLVKLLSGELKTDDEDVGKTTQRKLVEQSRDHLQMLVKKIPDDHFRSIKVAIGWASLLIEQFEEAISNEADIRKRTSEMMGV